MAEKPKQKAVAEVPEEEEEYTGDLNYNMKGNTFNMTFESGSQCIFQTGHPQPFPPK
jgi:frataxin-like iron-binding protein CyaY